MRRLPGAGTWLLDGEQPALYAEVDALAPTLEALRAPLLPGLPEDLHPAFWEWLALERRRLEELRRERFWQAAEAEPGRALGYLYELIQLDPLHESAVREATRLESMAGRVQAAWQLYENLRQSLWQELGVEPLVATQAQAGLLQPAVLSPFWVKNTGLLGALYDPLIGKALGLIHAQPQHAWTVASLASAVGCSRSSFSAHFTALVGEPPIEYLARWRMQIASRWLAGDPSLRVGEIATRVGYSSEAAFSKAFKRLIGTAPKAYRSGYR